MYLLKIHVQHCNTEEIMCIPAVIIMTEEKDRSVLFSIFYPSGYIGKDAVLAASSVADPDNGSSSGSGISVL
jgi:hypothetical protein